MTTFQVYDCVTFLDETGCRRVGNISSIVHAADKSVANVAVPGWRDAVAVDLADLAPHGEPGSR